MCITLYSSDDGYLGWVHILIIVNSACLQPSVVTRWCGYLFHTVYSCLSGIYLGSVTAGLCGKFISRILVCLFVFKTPHSFS